MNNKNVTNYGYVKPDNNHYPQDFELEDFKHSEYELEEIVQAEVINTSCIYFGETVWVTHKAYSLDTPWFKCELGYEPAAMNDVMVWLKEDELEFL